MELLNILTHPKEDSKWPKQKIYEHKKFSYQQGSDNVPVPDNIKNIALKKKKVKRLLLFVKLAAGFFVNMFV